MAAAGAHAPSLKIGLGLSALCLSGLCHAQEPPQIGDGPEAQAIATAAPELPSRLGALQVNMNVLLGVEPVDHADATAFGTSVELLYRCRIGAFAGLLSSKGNAQRAAVAGGQAPGDRISVPFGVAFRPVGHLGRRPGSGARGWANRLAAGVGLQAGVTVENIRTSASSATVAGLHLAATLDVPLWGGPVEGGVMVRLEGRLVVAPSVTLETNQVYMPTASGQFYGGLAWVL